MFAVRRKKLQNQRASLVNLSKEIIAKAEEEDRELTDEEKATLDSNETDIKSLSSEIDRLLRLEELEKENARPVPDRTKEPLDEAGDKKDDEDKPKKIIVPRLSTPKHFKTPEDAYLSGQWLLARLWQRPESILWCQEHGVPLTAQQLAQSGVNISGGGALVPTPLATVIIDLRETYGVFRQHARVWPMGSDSTNIPRREGGVTATFIGENEDLNDTEKSWGQVELVSRKLGAMVRYPSELSDDAIISVADDLARELAWAFAKKEDECGFIGDGTSTYGGISGLTTKLLLAAHAGSLHQAASGNVSFATLDLADFEAAVGILPEYASERAAWFISRAGFANSMQRLMDAAGGNTNDTLAGGSRRQFLGYPVVITQVMTSALTSTEDAVACVLGDLMLSTTLGDRKMIDIRSSEDRYFEKDQIAIRGIERIALVNHDVGDATNAGPVVALQFASS